MLFPISVQILAKRLQDPERALKLRRTGSSALDNAGWTWQYGLNCSEQG